MGSFVRGIRGENAPATTTVTTQSALSMGSFVRGIRGENAPATTTVTTQATTTATTPATTTVTTTVTTPATTPVTTTATTPATNQATTPATNQAATQVITTDTTPDLTSASLRLSHSAASREQMDKVQTAPPTYQGKPKKRYRRNYGSKKSLRRFILVVLTLLTYQISQENLDMTTAHAHTKQIDRHPLIASQRQRAHILKTSEGTEPLTPTPPYTSEKIPARTAVVRQDGALPATAGEVLPDNQSKIRPNMHIDNCLLYTSDAADE